MKSIKFLSIILALILSVSACKLPDNINPKRATEVPISTLFTNAQLNLVNLVNSSSVNFNISRLIVQYWQETTYFDESRYDFLDRSIPDAFSRTLYRDVLMDFKEAKDKLTSPDYGGNADERDNMVAIIDVLEVYAWHCLVDAFGNVPYSEALKGADNSTPAYDDAATIYADLIARLTTSIAALDGAHGSFGAADLMYGGDADAWKKFAASLKLRLGMRLADADASASKAAVESAVASGVISSAAENGTLQYIGVVPHVNTIYTAYVVNNRKDYLPTNTIVDYMLGLTDPRIGKFFTQVDTSGNGDFVYWGAVAGLDGAQSYNNFSNFAAMFFDPTLEAIMIDFVEVEFLLAEALERGYAVGGDAATHYNNAIEASILYYGGDATDVTNYLGQANVDYATAAGTYKEKIGTQKWIALYNRGVEGWAEWRRLDFPILNIPENMVYGDIPARMPYPFDEKLQNLDNYNAASSAIGGDDHRTKLFWDKN